ncbi:MAG TPA: hypothetical protein VEA99_04840, partial [Gemmatimonadaceae bacterium]|nr:hypothetical protein [Gemmatimonadaceae bacterium]
GFGLRASGVVSQAVRGVLCAALLAAPAAAQEGREIAERVARVADGEVRLRYAARPGVCGDGRDLVAYRESFFSGTAQGFGGWRTADCVPGDVRVTVTLRGGEPTRLRTQVGGSWSDGAATDLGLVPAREAAAWFLSLVPRLERSGAAARGRVLLPAVLADDPTLVPPLLAIARDGARQMGTRRQAAHWVGLLGDASVVPALAALAREGEVGSAALMALSIVPDGAGVPTLVELARAPRVETRRDAVFWLAQSGHATALAAVRRVAEDEREEVRVRQHAVFSLAHADRVAATERVWLRDLWRRVDDDRLKESIAQGVAQDESPEAGRWLLDRVRDPREPLRVRKQALFWAGQRKATPTAELVAIARAADQAEIADHAIFVLSQRDDDASLDALVAIAKGDADVRTRKRALFWLGQRDDARVVKVLRAMIDGGA